MERARSFSWFGLSALCVALAGLAAAAYGNLRQSNPQLAHGFLIGAWALVFAGVSLAIVGVVIHLWRPAEFKFEALVQDEGATARLSLIETSGKRIEGARCQLVKRGRVLREFKPERFIPSLRVTCDYPADFESLLIDGVLDKGRHRVEWRVRRLNLRAGRREWVDAARARLKVTDELADAARRLREKGTFLAANRRARGEVVLTLTRRELPIDRNVQCDERRRFEDGTLGPSYTALEDSSEETSLELQFPRNFRREVRQTRRQTAGGVMEIEPEYEYPSDEPGDHEVQWKVYWYATGGSVPTDREPTIEDLRRVVDVAQDKFTIPRAAAP